MPEPSADSPPLFSLVVATVDRRDEVERLLASLAQQDEQRFEIIIVDQNIDDRLVSVIRDADLEVPVAHLRSTRGLSRARNAALPHLQGRVVAFPDDDCWYPPGLLREVAGLIEAERLDGLVVRADLVGDGPTLGVIRTGTDAVWLDADNAWSRAISWTMFFCSHVVRRVGDFDEALGVGADSPWWAGEDSDYLLRALASGSRVRYEPTLAVSHPPPQRGPELLRRAYRYGLGTGRVWRKHRRPLRAVLHGLARPIGGAIRSGLLGDLEGVRFYVNSLQGRLRGWREPSAFAGDAPTATGERSTRP